MFFLFVCFTVLARIERMEVCILYIPAELIGDPRGREGGREAGRGGLGGFQRGGFSEKGVV